MTKLQEIKHILKMIEDKAWLDDSAVADEINARVGLVKNFKHKGYRGYSNISNRLKVFLSDDGREYFYCNRFLDSLDAIKGLEREGWNWYASSQYFADADRHIGTYVYHKGDVECHGEDLPTIYAAWLHAVLQTWLYDEENK